MTLRRCRRWVVSHAFAPSVKRRQKSCALVCPKPSTNFIILATHVPPFREACWHQGKISDGDWLPHFTCKAVGDVLLEIMKENPDHKLTVLCGHTHGGGEAQVLPNLKVLTGAARYGRPALQNVISPDEV